MTNNNRKPLIALVALSAALAMPLAFAQEKTEDAAQAQQQTEQSAEQATGSATTPTQSTDAGATQTKQGWADVDTNADGNISKEEAAANPGLSQVFDQADANADGSLTADEYKAFVSKNYGDQQK